MQNVLFKLEKRKLWSILWKIKEIMPKYIKLISRVVFLHAFMFGNGGI